MSRIVYSTLLAIAFIVLSAGNKKGKQSEHFPIARQVADTGGGLIEPRNIAPINVGRKRLVVDTPFSPIMAMRLLLPGNYYHVSEHGNGDDTIDLVGWSCRGCAKKKYIGWILNEPILFPTELNITEARDTLHYTDDSGRRHIIMAMASHIGTMVTDDLFIGRYFPVALSLAWFAERNNKWVLTGFTPCIGMFGAFQSLPKLNLIKLGKNNYGCYLDNGNGGPGQVYVHDLHIFGIVNGNVAMVLHDEKVGRVNTPSSTWWYELIPWAGKTNNTWMPITLNLEGTYYKNTPDTEFDWTDHVPEMTKAQLAKDSLNFKVVRKFQFSNGRYRRVSGKLTIQ